VMLGQKGNSEPTSIPLGGLSDEVGNSPESL
jgi:hypothetical protein